MSTKMLTNASERQIVADNVLFVHWDEAWIGK